MVKGVWQWEELKHAVLGVIVLCNKFQGDLHCKELKTKQIFHSLSKKCSISALYMGTDFASDFELEQAFKTP